MARILVVDDDRVNRLLLTRFLEASHHEVATADCGESAVEIFPDFEPDVVLLDVVMPGMDGFETTRVLKRITGPRHVPIILLTALSDEDSLVQGISAGADDFISKPVNRVVLNSRLYASLRTQRLFVRLAQQNRELQERQERDEREQRLAERLMSATIRSNALWDPRIRCFTKSYSLFNGDLLLARHTSGGRLRIVLGDFSGHGLQAAIGSMPVAVMFDQLTEEGYDLRQLLEAISERLRESLPTELFFAACAIELHEDGRSVEVWNCGLPDILLLDSDKNQLRRISSSTVPLGIVPWDPEWAGDVVPLNPEDRMYLFSDGLIEIRGQAGEEYGMERVEQVLSEVGTASHAFDRLMEDRASFSAGSTENDDVTLVELCVASAAASAQTQPPGCSRLRFEMGPDLLRETDLGRFIESVAAVLPLGVTDRSHVCTILSELVANAVDHGILGLESAIKTDTAGFAEYGRIRREKLDALKHGRLTLDLGLVRQEGSLALHIRVRDSGPGFTHKRPKGDVRVPYGRGLTIVNELCRRLVFLGSGNVVEAEYILLGAHAFTGRAPSAVGTSPSVGRDDELASVRTTTRAH